MVLFTPSETAIEKIKQFNVIKGREIKKNKRRV